MSFSGTTMAFFGQMPIFKTSGTSYVPAFGTNCCCPGITTGLVYVSVGDGVKWFKPILAFADFDQNGNVIAAQDSLGVSTVRVSRIDPQGNETILHSFSADINHMECSASGDAYIQNSNASGVQKISSSGGLSWTTTVSNAAPHYSRSRDQVFIPGVNSVWVVNSSTGTTDQFVELPSNLSPFTTGNSCATDDSGNVYLSADDTDPGGGLKILKFNGSATSIAWETSTALALSVPLFYSVGRSKLYACQGESDVYEIDPSTGTASQVPYISEFTSVTDIDGDSSGNLFVASTVFGGTNYAVIRYDGTTPYWGYRPSGLFDFTALNKFGVDATGTAIAVTVNFQYSSTRQPLF